MFKLSARRFLGLCRWIVGRRCMWIRQIIGEKASQAMSFSVCIFENLYQPK